ncbi:MAG: NADH-quinone oxidoreductase subunit N, partial [Sphingomonas bacterium]|nr:NADH-quinone oxidoreductase subunit N [Sphingomonas bacterium]
MNLAAILPEVILTLGALILMMVAAFGGHRAAGVTTWVAVVLLVVAAIATLGRPQDAGPLFGGLIVADGFGAFGKVVI